MTQARMIGVAHAVPANKMTNFDLEKVMDTSDTWIKERTGIHARHIADPHMTTLELALQSIHKTFALAPHITPDTIDAIIVGTSTPDYIFPSLACEIAKSFNISCMAFDLQAACCGFVYATDVAKQYIENNSAKRVLVVGVEIISRVLDWNNRKTGILFGDGAGSCLLEASDYGIITSCLKTIPDHDYILCIRNPLIHPTLSDGKIHMDGPKVFKQAVQAFTEVIERLVSDPRCPADSITRVVPHQANQRILEAVMDRSSISREKYFSCVADYGNTSSASIPIALSQAFSSESAQKERVLVVSFGGGLTTGGFVMDYIPSGCL